MTPDEQDLHRAAMTLAIVVLGVALAVSAMIGETSQVLGGLVQAAGLVAAPLIGLHAYLTRKDAGQ